MRPGILRCVAVASACMAAWLTFPCNAYAANPIDAALHERGDGKLRFAFPARAGVTGDGHRISFLSPGGTQVHRGRWYDDEEFVPECDPCDVRVTLTVQDGDVVRIRYAVGGAWGRSVRNQWDLGTVPAPEAVDFLVRRAWTETGSVAEDALDAAVLGYVPWQELLRLARERQRPRRVRKTAVFWLGQEAQTAVSAHLEGLVDEVEDVEVRKQAVFALSQRPDRESLPRLMNIARVHRSVELRRTALFWLAQKDAPEVVDFFEEILSGRSSER